MREKLVVLLYCIYIVFGVLLYDIELFVYIDEIYPWLLFSLLVLSREKFSKPFRIWMGVALFYLLYSILIQSNVLNAIFFDFIIQVKPYLTFFSICCLAPGLSERQCAFLKKFTLCCVPFLIAVGISHLGHEAGQVKGEILSGARFSSACISVALSYYLFSRNDSNKTMMTCWLIGAIGLLWPTSKFIVELGVALAVLLSFKRSKFRIGTIPIILCSAAAYFVYTQIHDELVLYLSNTDVARNALYVTSFQILGDYVPFGSGLGSFACAASANWYSPLYAKYNIDMIWGLMEDGNVNFFSDTFYPSLAQFGIIGVLLFVSFLVYIYRESLRGLKSSGNERLHKVVLLCLGYILIESVADASIIGNRGVGVMMILALAICKMNRERIRE